MASSANVEIDPVLKKAIRLLHSTNPNSATEMRLLLDELITQRFGPEKTLSNLNKRCREQLEELEANFPGMVVTPPPAPPKPEQVDEVINLTNSPGSVDSSVEESNLKDFGDLNCCVCGEMMITATNRLIECSKCSTLYHQECHKPPITDEEASGDHEHNWQCDNCVVDRPSTSKSTTSSVTLGEEQIATSMEKLKSRSSSPFCKQDSNISAQGRESASSSTSSSKHHHHHHKSSHSSKSSTKSSSKHHDGSSSSKRKSHK